jgi:hypothetical protein
LETKRIERKIEFMQKYYRSNIKREGGRIPNDTSSKKEKMTCQNNSEKCHWWITSAKKYLKTELT